MRLIDFALSQRVQKTSFFGRLFGKRLTRLSQGTRSYMAPEQIRNAAPHIGPPTDLYALGSILFELLMRREVFDGKSTELLRKHRDDALPDFELPPSVPNGVAEVVRRLLAKKPWDRYRFAADARQAVDDDPVGRRKPGAKDAQAVDDGA